MVDDPEGGYATPAAAVISFAIAIVVATLTARGMAELRLARAELARAQAEYGLDAAQNAAMLAISTSSRPPPYRWTIASLGQPVDVLAEPERAKLSPVVMAGLEDGVFQTFGIQDAVGLRGRLGEVAPGARLIWIADQAPGALWRACAPSFVSPFGRAAQLLIPIHSEPEAGQQPSLWRAGEVWRIQVTDKAGWRDERIVRFTGNGLSPAAVIGRRLSRGWKGQQRCEALFGVA